LVSEGSSLCPTTNSEGREKKRKEKKRKRCTIVLWLYCFPQIPGYAKQSKLDRRATLLFPGLIFMFDAGPRKIF
jgi:hypothetical protein